MKKATPSGFWRLFGSRIIDLSIVTILSVLTLFLFIDKNKHFNPSYGFYIWSILTVLYMLIIMIAIPLATKGISIGMFIIRIKIISLRGSLYFNFLKREIAYSIAWIFVILLSMSVINHTLINQVAEIKGTITVGETKKSLLTNWEKTRITLCGSISGLITFIQMWLAITIIPNKNKRGWLDRWACTQVVRISSFTSLEQEEKEGEIIKPIKSNNIKVKYEL